jgi:hypothetical protein
MADERKAFAVQRKVAGDQPRIEDRNIVRFGQRGRFGFARRRIEGVGAGLSECRRKIVQLGGNEGSDSSLACCRPMVLDSIVCSV